MKRLMTLVVLAVFLALAVSAQGNRIYIEPFEIEPGESRTVPVMLSNVDPSRGVQFNVTLPEGLELKASELTPYSQGMKMILSCEFSPKNGCYTVFIYPMGYLFPCRYHGCGNDFENQCPQEFQGWHDEHVEMFWGD